MSANINLPTWFVRSCIIGILLPCISVVIDVATRDPNASEPQPMNPIAGVLFLGGLAFAIPMYFLPTIIAKQRAHKDETSIFITNLLFGWTFVGWGIAAIWAYKSDK